jgi:hypothetical protein
MNTAFASLCTASLGASQGHRQRLDQNGEGREAHSLPESAPLAAALKSLEILTFTPASVSAYKTKVVADSEVRYLKALRHIRWIVGYEEGCGARGLFEITQIVAPTLLAAAATALPAAGLAFGAAWLATWGALGAFAPFYAVTSIMFVAAALALMLALRIGPKSLHQRLQRWIDRYADHNSKLKWCPVPLEQFPGRVPNNVRDLGAEILAECPAGTRLMIDHVDVAAVPYTEAIREEARAWANDPFLIVCLGAESFAVAVWDEKDCRLAME